MIDILRKLKLYGPTRFLAFALHEAKRLLWFRLIRGSFSLNGEDLIIAKLCGPKQKGFYIDVGAHSPTRMSNTRRFYGRGWRGINIDADPTVLAAFHKIRPRDININCGIGAADGASLEFYRLFPSTLSTFSKEFMELQRSRGHALVSTVKMPIFSLATVLEQHCPKGTEIDFLSIDVEGGDFDVLKGNDWAKFRPRVIVIESITQFYSSDVENCVFAHSQFLKGHGYELVYHNGIDGFYLRR